jgi:hypothetical protein
MSVDAGYPQPVRHSESCQQILGWPHDPASHHETPNASEPMPHQGKKDQTKPKKRCATPQGGTMTKNFCAAESDATIEAAMVEAGWDKAGWDKAGWDKAGRDEAATGEIARVEAAPSRRNQRGMVSAEWAVGIIAAVAIAGVLLGIVTSGPIHDALLKFILLVIQSFAGFLR